MLAADIDGFLALTLQIAECQRGLMVLFTAILDSGLKSEVLTAQDGYLIYIPYQDIITQYIQIQCITNSLIR